MRLALCARAYLAVTAPRVCLVGVVLARGHPVQDLLHLIDCQGRVGCGGPGQFGIIEKCGDPVCWEAWAACHRLPHGDIWVGDQSIDDLGVDMRVEGDEPSYRRVGVVTEAGQPFGGKLRQRTQPVPTAAVVLQVAAEQQCRRRGRVVLGEQDPYSQVGVLSEDGDEFRR